jgi:hypothetical protein
MPDFRFASEAVAASSNAAPAWLSLLRGISWAVMVPLSRSKPWNITRPPDVPAMASRRHFAPDIITIAAVGAALRKHPHGQAQQQQDDEFLDQSATQRGGEQ